MKEKEGKTLQSGQAKPGYGGAAGAVNPLGVDSIGKLLRSFAIPSIIAMLVTNIYNIVDQIFIGWGVGYLGNAATTVSFPLTTICLSIALLIGIGSAANFSLELGRGNPHISRETAGCGMTMTIAAGLAYLILGQIFLPQMLLAFGGTPENMPYAMEYSRIILLGMPFLIFSNCMSNLIRADGSPSYSMTCMVTGAILNCFLDPLFIFGFGWGMAGAAWATILGQILSAFLAGRYVLRFKQIHLEKQDFRLRGRLCIKIMELGMANCLNQLTILAVQITLNNSLRIYGAQTIYGANTPIAAAGIAMKLNGMFVAVVVGLAQGSQPIIGYNFGAKQYQRVKKTVRYAMTCGLTAGFLVWGIFQLFPRQCILLFGNGDELYLEFGSLFLRTYLFCTPIVAVQMLSSNYFASIGQPAKGVVLSLSRQILLFIPLILILPLFMHLQGVLYAAPIADFLSVCFSGTMLMISFKKMTKLEKEQQLQNAAA